MSLRIFLSLLFLSNISFASYKYETIVENLDDAWSMVFIDENTILFTELPGNLKILNLSDKSITNIANTTKRTLCEPGRTFRSNS
jgi:glucose/arabinose dehydrogenase